MPTQDSDATVEIDERRIVDLAALICRSHKLSWNVEKDTREVLRTAWRESALAERQRAADDARGSTEETPCE